MELVTYRHLWGVDENWETVFPKIKEAGYDGIETHLLPGKADRTRFRSLLAEHDFRFITMIFTAGNSVEEHLASFESQIAEALEFKPVLINCHSGRDEWPEKHRIEFFEQALSIEKKYDAVVAHETHRGRILYNPWSTSDLLDRFNDLKLCCDFSHWVCVCERLFDEPEIIEKCAARTMHLHARVGYEEGPQVPDPRAPEFEHHLHTHEGWWDKIWASQKARGMNETNLTPEFGPPPYLHALPHTEAPVASLWDICNWQAERQRRRFEIKYGK